MQAVHGVPKIDEGINPATWMLEVTTVGSESKLGVNFTDIYNGSKFAKCARPLALLCAGPQPHESSASSAASPAAASSGHGAWHTWLHRLTCSQVPQLLKHAWCDAGTIRE